MKYLIKERKQIKTKIIIKEYLYLSIIKQTYWKRRKDKNVKKIIDYTKIILKEEYKKEHIY